MFGIQINYVGSVYRSLAIHRRNFERIAYRGTYSPAYGGSGFPRPDLCPHGQRFYCGDCETHPKDR